MPSPEEREVEKKPRGGPTSQAAGKATVRRDDCENLSSWTNQGSIHGKIARLYHKTCRLVLHEHYKGFFRTDALGEGDVSRRGAHGNCRDSRRGFDKTLIRQLILGTEEARSENELVHALHEKHPFYSFNGTRCKGDQNIYGYGAMKYITNLKNHLTVNLERFMLRAVFALCPGVSRNGKRAIIKRITNNREHEDEVQFVG